ncbi:MAG TPA: hypothetical protein VIK89_12405 [Cytophagaceae bacterium]
MKLADSLYAIKEFQQAQIEYEKIIYRSGNPDTINQALLKKIYCQKQQGNYSEAKQTAERLNFFSGSPEVQNQLRYEAAVVNYLASDYSLAYNHILHAKNQLKDSSLLEQLLFIEILVLNDLLEWEKAREVFREYQKLRGGELEVVDELYGFLKKGKLKSKKKAEWLSVFVPGSGQVYAGYFAQGIISFVLVFTPVGLGLLYMSKGYYITGILSGLMVGQMFYFGGVVHSKNLTEKRNNAFIQKHNSRIKNYLVDSRKQG